MMRHPNTRLALVLLALFALSAGAATVAADDKTDEVKEEPRYGCSYELQACLDWMAESFGKRGWAGMQLDGSDGTFKVTGVHAGSPAERAKVRVGDWLVAVNGVEYLEENNEKLVALQKEMKPGAHFTYTLKRGGKRRNVEVVLVEMPIDVIAVQVGMHLLTDHVDAKLAFSADD
jgi:S1-C subfamily serine protease